MGSVGEAYDNAMCESFFAALECELLDRRKFATRAEARMAVFEFIEGWYNPGRRHSALGYLSPINYERRALAGLETSSPLTVHETGGTPVAATGPDLLLVLETDAWWDERLSALRDRFRHEIQSIPEDHAFYGTHLFSKLELVSPEFRFYFGADTPTAVSEVRLPDGEIIGFIGLHPRPPLAWSQPTTMRDAHILQTALRAREFDSPTIVAGDFNAVPWERVTRRAMRIGALLDPRVGRGLYSTYDTDSLLISWPLDQILFQPQFTMQGYATLPDFGSDHRAVVAGLCHQPAAAQAAPELLTEDLAEAEASIDTARRAQEAATD